MNISQSNPPPIPLGIRTVFTPSTIVPEQNPKLDRIRQQSTGQGDERQTRIDNFLKSSDIPPEQFVQFIMEKFQNMSLADIKSILSQIPIASASQSEDSEQTAISTNASPSVENEKEIHREIPPENCLLQSMGACRAAIVPGMQSQDQPIMQSTIIEPYVDIIPTEKPSPEPNPFEIAEAPELNIPREPIDCPISSCNNSTVFVSDFTKHIKTNHVRVPIEVLHPKCGSNLFIDPALDDVNQNRSRMLYLVTDKIRYIIRNIHKNKYCKSTVCYPAAWGAIVLRTTCQSW